MGQERAISTYYEGERKVPKIIEPLLGARHDYGPFLHIISFNPSKTILQDSCYYFKIYK